MSVGKICTHQVITVDRDIDVANAAWVMRDKHIGYLIVTDPASGGGAPVGVITDRDIVVKVTALDIDPHSVKVGDVMTWQPLLAAQDDEVSDTLQRMRELGVRRVPVVGPQGQITGVLSLDDVIDHLLGELSDVAGSVHKEQRSERQRSRI